MHILHIYKDYYPVLGGIENHIKMLAESLAARNHRVTVLVTSSGRHDEIVSHGNLTIIKAARVWHTASTPFSLQQMRHARRTTAVDVVNLHFPYPPGDIAALLVPGQPPLVVTYHSDIIRQQMLLRLYHPLLQHTLARATRIVTTSPNYIASSPWLRPHADRCVVASLSVDPDRFAAPPVSTAAALRAAYSGGPLLLFVGRLRYYKGLHFLIEAMGQLRSPAHLLIVGSGPEQQRLQDQAHTAGLAERIHFLGEISDADLPAVYAAADLFVFPSHLRAEAFGIAQLEAQAASLPVICTELGTGTSYVTQHGITGLVIPPADPAALARATDVLLANPDLARRMGTAGRARVVQEFSHSRLVDRMEQIYGEVV